MNVRTWKRSLIIDQLARRVLKKLNIEMDFLSR
jgi:hypothetical protein